MKKQIAKHRFTLEQAEQFQNTLYDMYEYVKLIDLPRFQRVGVYIWEVE